MASITNAQNLTESIAIASSFSNQAKAFMYSALFLRRKPVQSLFSCPQGISQSRHKPVKAVPIYLLFREQISSLFMLV